MRLLATAASLALALSLSACDKGKAPPSPAATGPAAGPAAGPPPAMPVTGIEAAPRTVALTIDTVGQAEGSREVEVRARVAGIVERKLFREGERVAAGADLYRIERAPFEIALAQARAGLAQEQARVDQTRREAERLRPLADQQAISRREYEEAASAARTAQASLAAAQARVREAELNLSYTTVAAPIAGVTGRSLRSEGSLVGPGADGLLTTIAQTDPIWVRFGFSEAQLARMKAGKAAEVTLTGADGKPLGRKGRLNFSATSVDTRLGTVAMRAEFANPDLAILPGQFVQASVKVGEREAYLVPQHAVVQNERGRMVWTVSAEGKATPTPVQAGEWIGSDWVIESGLKPGDRVIVDNLIKIRPGAPVAARAPEAAAAPGKAGAPSPAAKSGAPGAPGR